MTDYYITGKMKNNELKITGKSVKSF